MTTSLKGVTGGQESDRQDFRYHQRSQLQSLGCACESRSHQTIHVRYECRYGWHKGSPIIWKGQWQGNSYEDKGVIVQFRPGRTLQYSHFSPLSGVADKPENYHTVTIELSNEGNQTRVSLTQDNNATEDERAQSEKNWEMMLTALKSFLEQ